MRARLGHHAGSDDDQGRPVRGPSLRLTLAALVTATALGGCAPWLERPVSGWTTALQGEPPGLEPPVPCGVGPHPSRGIQGEDTVVIGSVRFGGLGFQYGPERFAPGSPPLTLPVTVPPNLRVVIEVPPDRRRHVGLATAEVPPRTPALAHRALRCPAAPDTRYYTVTFVLDGPQCVPIAVTHRYGSFTQVARFGVRRCPPAGPAGP